MRKDSSTVSVALKAVNCFPPHNQPRIIPLIEVDIRAGIIIRNNGCAATFEKRKVRLSLNIINTIAMESDVVVQIKRADPNKEGTFLLPIALHSAVFLLIICATPEEEREENKKNTDNAI